MGAARAGPNRWEKQVVVYGSKTWRNIQHAGLQSFDDFTPKKKLTRKFINTII